MVMEMVSVVQNLFIRIDSIRLCHCHCNAHRCNNYDDERGGDGGGDNRGDYEIIKRRMHDFRYGRCNQDNDGDYGGDGDERIRIGIEQNYPSFLHY